MLMKFDTPVKHTVVQKSTHEDAVVFWHNIIPSAQHRSCPEAPVASALTDIHDKDTENQDRAFFLGSWLTAAAAEYVLMALLCICGFLLVTTFVAVVSMLRMKHHRAFHRLSS